MNPKDRAERLVGIDAAPVIKQLQEEIAENYKAAQRRMEVDGDVAFESKVHLDCIIVKGTDGYKMMALKEPVPGLGKLEVTDRDERFLKAEMRLELANRLVKYRICNQEHARKLAAEATFLIHDGV